LCHPIAHLGAGRAHVSAVRELFVARDRLGIKPPQDMIIKADEVYR
jgi:hypothetical protein